MVQLIVFTPCLVQLSFKKYGDSNVATTIITNNIKVKENVGLGSQRECIACPGGCGQALSGAERVRLFLRTPLISIMPSLSGYTID